MKSKDSYLQFIPHVALNIWGNSFYGFDNKTKENFQRTQESIRNLVKGNEILVCNKKLYNNAINNFDDVYDILELFVFLYPKAMCAGTYESIYNYLYEKNQLANQKENIVTSEDKKTFNSSQLAFLILELIVLDIHKLTKEKKDEIIQLVQFIEEDSWNFSSFLLYCLGNDGEITEGRALKIWEKIPEYQSDDNAKKNQSPIDTNIAIDGITKEDITYNLQFAIDETKSKDRKEQLSYALQVGEIFQDVQIKSNENLENTKEEEIFSYSNIEKESKNDAKKILFAEAGTGVGKTLGYLSATVAFLKKNPRQQVLISTYSKALQKQILAEFRRYFYKNNKNLSANIIKGKNNYLCLLNLQLLVENSVMLPKAKLYTAIIIRWIEQSEYGDIEGGDLNPLAFEIFPNNFFYFLLNKREECIYNKCKHFKNCFVMRAKYLSKNSNIVISNHSYSLLNRGLDIKYAIFDESHNLFDCSDDIFAKEMSIQSNAQIKGWIQGYNNKLAKTKSWLNGIKSRVESLINEDRGIITEEEKNINYNIENILESLVSSCDILADNMSLQRIQNSLPNNLMEEFLYEIYLYVMIKGEDTERFYTQEMEVNKDFFSEPFLSTIQKLKVQLQQIINISDKLIFYFNAKFKYADSDKVKSIEDFLKIFSSIFYNNISEYLLMLEEFDGNIRDNNFVYRFLLQREEGKLVNIGYYKNYIDPTQALATITNNMKGLCFTSATLVQSNNMEKEKIGNNLRIKYGLNYLDNYEAKGIKLLSPFNYRDQARVIFINNNNLKNLGYIIGELCRSSKGGVLGIFTAILRLKEVYKEIQGNLGNENIRLMAQHINDQTLGSLIDIFKDDLNSCLLATDAARDGIDIPGGSLRMVIFEKIPWNKPDILLKARIKFFGREYGDEIVQLKIKQAFGRLIRTETDRGIFIMIDKALPSKLTKIFPNEVLVEQLKVEEAIKQLEIFFKN